MDAVRLYNAFNSDELIEIGKEAYNLVHDAPDSGQRKFLFAYAFMPKLLALIAMKCQEGALDHIADFYIKDYWSLHETEVTNEKIN